MSTPIGFVIEGVSSLKVFGPLLQETHMHGLRPHVIVASDGGGGGKVYDTLTPEMIQGLFPDIPRSNIHVYGGTTISRIAAEANLAGVVFTNAYHKYTEEIVELAKLDIKTFGLDYFVNSLYTAATPATQAQVVRCLEHITERHVISGYVRDLEWHVYPPVRQYAHKYLVTGSPIVDTVRSVDPTQARRQLGFDTEQKIICLMAPNIREHHSYYLYGFFSRTRLKRAIAAVASFCHTNGYLLAIKSREKQWDTDIYRTYADRFITEIPDARFPHTSALLLSVSDVLIHFGSMGVIEAAAAGVPSIGIGPQSVDKLHSYMEPRARRIIRDSLCSVEPGSLFNFGKVSASIPIISSVDRLHRLCHSMIEAKEKGTNDYETFLTTFSGGSTPTATNRILQRVAQAVQSATVNERTAQLVVTEQIRTAR